MPPPTSRLLSVTHFYGFPDIQIPRRIFRHDSWVCLFSSDLSVKIPDYLSKQCTREVKSGNLICSGQIYFNSNALGNRIRRAYHNYAIRCTQSEANVGRRQSRFARAQRTSASPKWRGSSFGRLVASSVFGAAHVCRGASHVCCATPNVTGAAPNVSSARLRAPNRPKLLTPDRASKG